jgi:hypothetical protein
MVLYPLSSPPGSATLGEPTSAQPLSAWSAIEDAQRRSATEWWLIGQPDHAALAGDLACRIQSAYFPRLDAEVVQAIGLHDEGWAEFDDGCPKTRNGHPASFLEISPSDFLRAWRSSIHRAQQVAPIGGVLVSEHFCRLGRNALSRGASPDSEALIQEFLEDEQERQQLLIAAQNRDSEEIRLLVDVLQFCDLLSLYLCCGSREWVVFPQEFHGQTISMRYQHGLARTQPSIFGDGGASLAVQARKYPADFVAETIPILLG